MSGAGDDGRAREGAGESGADGGFRIESVGEAEAWPPAVIPAGHEVMRALAAGARAGENQGAWVSIHSWIGCCHREIFVLIHGLERGAGKLITQAEVQSEAV